MVFQTMKRKKSSSLVIVRKRKYAMDACSTPKFKLINCRARVVKLFISVRATGPL